MGLNLASRKVSGCDGKQPMERALAVKVAKQMSARNRKVNPYRCPVCHSWHVGGADFKAKL